MVGLVIGIFLLLGSVFMLLFGSGDISGFIGVAFVIWIALVLISSELKKKKQNKKTSKHGESCYVKILDCVKTGNFVLNKEEYKVIVSVFVPSLQKRLILEETVGYNSFEEYPKNSYFLALYFNGDINIQEKVLENVIPSDTLKTLNEDAVMEEYREYLVIKKEKEDKAKEIVENKVENIMPVINRFMIIKDIITCYIFSLIIIFVTPYLSKTFKLLIDFSNNIPMSIIYLVVLVINLYSVIPMCLNPVNSKKRVIYGLLWFITMAFMLLSFAN